MEDTMEDTLENKLKKLGLSDKEVKMYLVIVKEGFITASVLSRKTGFHRPTIYDLSEKLLSKGLIIKTIRHTQRGFQTTNYNGLVLQAKEKQEIAQSVAQELEKIKAIAFADYEVEVFEGDVGLKSHFAFVESLLKKEKLSNYLVLGSDAISISKIKFFLFSRIKDSLTLAKKVDFRIIWSSSAKKNIFFRTLSPISKQKFLPDDTRTECTTIVFNDYIAIIFYMDKPVLVRIHSKKVAESYKAQFELLWKLV